MHVIGHLAQMIVLLTVKRQRLEIYNFASRLSTTQEGRYWLDC